MAVARRAAPRRQTRWDSPVWESSSLVAILLFLFLGKWLDARLGHRSLASHPGRLLRSGRIDVLDVSTGVSAGKAQVGAWREMKAMILFAVAMVLIIVGGGLLLAVPFSSPSERRAIEVSGIVALVVQLFGFAITRSVSTQNFFSGWVIGVALRFVTLVSYALRCRQAAGTAGAGRTDQSRVLSLRIHAGRTEVAHDMTLSPKLVLLLIASLLGASPSLAHAAPAEPVAAFKRRRPSRLRSARQSIALPALRRRKSTSSFPHISDSDELDVPWLNASGFKVVSSAALGACHDRQLRSGSVADETRRHDDLWRRSSLASF